MNEDVFKENDLEETKSFWDQIAQDWEIQVGNEGDSNRILNSDPVLWKFAGDLSGKNVLDAGCGTGYLSGKLHKKGANVIGVDFSEEMIRIARRKWPGIDFRIESISSLRSIESTTIDIVISNYVLMDTPNLKETVRAFSRVLKDDGQAVLVFSHPCFPQGNAIESHNGRMVQYNWEVSYFEQHKCTDPPWDHFKSEFIWFHRPLSDYWKAFRSAGFEVTDFEEPRITEERYSLAENQKMLHKSKNRPFSVAFRLRKIRTI